MKGRVLRRLDVAIQRFPIRGAFRIARGAKTEAAVLLATVRDAATGLVGRGEAVPYARYGESLEASAAALTALADGVAAGLDRAALRRMLPPGAARNALDCALWDLEAKLSGVPVWRAAGLTQPPRPLLTCYTLSLDAPEIMAAAAADAVAAGRPLLKMKLTGDGDLARVRAVRQAAPAARLTVDANEGWSLDHLIAFGPVFADLGVELIEQPLPAEQDEALRGFVCPVPLAADESCRDLASLGRLRGLYRAINVKLDKTGGLTEGLELLAAARADGFQVMIGCMVATSLAMAPALLLAQGAEWADLDGPLLLAQDRDPALRYDGATVHPAHGDLWG